MTLDQIEAFLTVVECGNFAGAAAALFITQSALGRRISDLEKELGCTLVMRRRGIRQIELTAEGARFLPLAKSMDGLRAKAMGIRGESQPEVLRLTLISSLLNVFLPSIPRAFEAVGYETSITFANTRSAVAAIQAGNEDFAVVGNSLPVLDDTCLVEELAAERFVVLSRCDSPYGVTVDVGELDPGNEIYSRWNTATESWHRRVFGVDFRPRFTLDGVFSPYDLLSESSSYWAISPYGFAMVYKERTPVKISRLGEDLPERTLTLLSRRPVHYSAHEVLIAALRECLTSVGGFKLFV